MASMALLVLQPAASIGDAVEAGFRGAGGDGAGEWRESVKQACGIAIAGAGVLTLAGLASVK